MHTELRMVIIVSCIHIAIQKPEPSSQLRAKCLQAVNWKRSLRYHQIDIAHRTRNKLVAKLGQLHFNPTALPFDQNNPLPIGLAETTLSFPSILSAF